MWNSRSAPCETAKPYGLFFSNEIIIIYLAFDQSVWKHTIPMYIVFVRSLVRIRTLCAPAQRWDCTPFTLLDFSINISTTTIYRGAFQLPSKRFDYFLPYRPNGGRYRIALLTYALNHVTFGCVGHVDMRRIRASRLGYPRLHWRLLFIPNMGISKLYFEFSAGRKLLQFHLIYSGQPMRINEPFLWMTSNLRPSPSLTMKPYAACELIDKPNTDDTNDYDMLPGI